jgi:hypothetical protein
LRPIQRGFHALTSKVRDLLARVPPADRERGTMRVMDSRGHKPRTVDLDSGATATIQRWAGMRREAGIGGRTRALLRAQRSEVQILPRYQASKCGSEA